MYRTAHNSAWTGSQKNILIRTETFVDEVIVHCTIVVVFSSINPGFPARICAGSMLVTRTTYTCFAAERQNTPREERAPIGRASAKEISG